MTQLLLSPVAELRQQLGFDDMPDINNAITGAMQAATASLASGLNMKFDTGTYEDTFFMKEPSFMEEDGFHSEFRLSQGLVQSINSAQAFIRASTGVNAVQNNIDISGNIVLNGEKGQVFDYLTRYDRHLVTIAFTAGFAADGTDATLYDQTKVPEWLKEANRLKALMMLNGMPPLEEAGIKLETKSLHVQLHHLMGYHKRYLPCAVLPIQTKQTA